MHDFETQPAIINESASLLTFIDGEVLGVPVDTEQFLVLPPDLKTDDFTTLMMSGESEPNDDADGDGVPDEDIVVTGRKPRTYAEDPSDPGDDTGGGGGDTGGGGGGLTNPPAEDETQDCTDRSAIAAENDIKAEPDDGYKEHSVVHYRDANGTIQKSPPIQGDWGEMPVTAIRAWMEANGVTFQQVTGWTHNHDPYHYGQTNEAASLNSYPSGGAPGTGPLSEAGGDWRVADWFINNGTNAATFSIYILNPDNELREFDYADKAYWWHLTDTQRKNETGLPDELVSDGSSC